MKWFVSARSAETISSTIRIGESADWDEAVAQAIQTGRELTHADDGTQLGPARNYRIGDGEGVSIADGSPTASEDDLRRRIQQQTEYDAGVVNPAPHQPASPTQSGSVAEQWDRIFQWLRGNLASVSIAGATDEQIQDAMRSTGGLWPEELTSFFRLVNGFPRENWVSIFPMHELFDVDRTVSERQLELDIWGEIDAEMGAEPQVGTSAGQYVGTYLPEFIPFAGADGYLLFVDARRGPLHGCVTEFQKVDADGAGPKWPSLSAMLTDLADSLETGTAFDGHTHFVVDGQLRWQ
ncbi:SMI1/KNR4 family protein [Rhodococcus sp. IEGM1428]|uniref:SMI1/KNR4 family protein n=1 Tax=Rhodococcus sp. IEGM1428 TaxID=3392191 RepID=UPI003D12B844